MNIRSLLGLKMMLALRYQTQWSSCFLVSLLPTTLFSTDWLLNYFGHKGEKGLGSSMNEVFQQIQQRTMNNV